MLVIISDKIATEKNTERLLAILDFCGAFKFKARIKNKLTGAVTKTAKWAVDISADEIEKILTARPDISARIDTITGSELFTCENFAEKYWTLE